jgi:hypothetical protein
MTIQLILRERRAPLKAFVVEAVSRSKAGRKNGGPDEQTRRW